MADEQVPTSLAQATTAREEELARLREIEAAQDAKLAELSKSIAAKQAEKRAFLEIKIAIDAKAEINVQKLQQLEDLYRIKDDEADAVQAASYQKEREDLEQERALSRAEMAKNMRSDFADLRADIVRAIGNTYAQEDIQVALTRVSEKNTVKKGFEEQRDKLEQRLKAIEECREELRRDGFVVE